MLRKTNVRANRVFASQHHHHNNSSSSSQDLASTGLHGCQLDSCNSQPASLLLVSLTNVYYLIELETEREKEKELASNLLGRSVIYLNAFEGPEDNRFEKNSERKETGREGKR